MIPTWLKVGYGLLVVAGVAVLGWELDACRRHLHDSLTLQAYKQLREIEGARLGGAFDVR